MSETVDHITTAKSILAAVANFKDYSSIYANILQPNNATNTSNNSNNNNNSSVPSTPSTSRGSSNDTKKQKKRCTCKAFTPTVGVYCVECKNEYKAQDDHENKLRARAARLGEALGGLSVVAYEVMRAFDFSDPRNAPPPCTDPEMYSRRLEHKLAAAIESMKRMAEGVIRDAFRPEQENIQGEVQRANKVKAAYEKRNNLIRELLATEKHFCEGLGVITDVWKPEMTAAGLVDPFTDDVLFKPIPAIKELSKELVQDFSRILARPLEKQNLGKVLCKKAHKFNVFKPSCLSQQDATAMIAKLSSNNTFKELQNKLKKSSQITQNLSEYIFTPAQRMTRYPLLLNGIIKATEKRNPDYANLVVFVDKLKSILDEVNKKNAQQSSINLFFTLKDKFKWTHCEYDLMASKTIVFFHGKVNWTFKPSSSSVTSTSTPSETSGNYLFMTNSLILACAEEKGRSYTELETLYVDSTTLRDADSKKNELTLKARPRKGESPPASVGTLVIQSTDYLSLMNYKRFFDDCKESVPQHPLIPVGKGATPVVLGAPQPPPHPPHSPSKGTRSFTIASIECPPPLPPVKTAAAAQNTAVNGGSGNGSVTPHPKKVRTARGLGVEDAVELFYRKEDAPASQVFVSVAQNGSGGGGSSGNNNNNSGSNGSSKKDKKKQIESEKDLAAESKSTSNDSHSIDDEEEITTTGSPQNFSVSLNIGSSGSSSSSSGKSKKNRRSTYSLK